MIFTEAERNLARDLFARIRIDTAVPGGGVTRESFGLGETAALQNIAEVAREQGLEPRADRAGNLYITPGGSWPSDAVVIGSHLDSVPCGGNYDGLAGVVAGLLIVLKAKKRGINKPLVALGLRGEESAWYGIPYVGAKALMGLLSKRDLERKHRTKPERSLLQAIGSCALTDVHAIMEGERLLSVSMIKEFWELHIEQGPILQNLGVPIGVVTGIRGSIRAPSARMYGTAGHSGTTPHHLRQDAVMRFCELMTALEEQRCALHESGKDIVFTCGVAGTDPGKHAITSIADLMHFSLDVRSIDAATVLGFIDYAKQYAGDTVYWDELVTTPGIKVKVETLERVAAATKKLGIEAITMPSGAGHDAAIFAQSGVEAGMVFVRNQHGSHNPHEDMNIDDFMLGVETLWEVLR